MKQLKKKGKYTGGKTPLGWTLDEEGNEVPNEGEQEIINLVRRGRKRGLSYQVIADELTEAGFMTRNGTAKFSRFMVRRIESAETKEERAARIDAA